MLNPAIRTAGVSVGVFVAGVLAAILAFLAGVGAIAAASGLGGLAAVAAVLACAVVPVVAVWAWRDPRVAIAVVFATMPLPFGVAVGTFELQPVEVAIGLAVAVVIASRLARRAPLRMPTAGWWLVGLVVWAVVSTAFAANIGGAIKGTISLIEAVALIFAAYNVVGSLSDVRWLAGVCAGVAALVALPTLWSLPQMTVKYGGANVEGRAAGLFQGIPALQQYEVHLGPNQFGAYMSVGLFAALALALGARTPRRRLLATLAMLPISGAVIASLSRGAWIGVAVGALFVFVFARPSRRVLLGIAVAAVVLGAAVVALNPNIASAVADRADKLTVRGPYDRRPEMWVEAIRQISADPLTGSGPANYRIVAQVHGLGRFAPYHAHNFFLTWGAEVGLPAVALLIVFCVAVGRAVRAHGKRRSRDSIEHAIVIALAAAPVAFLVHGLVHYTSQHFALYALIGILLGACDLYAPSRLRVPPRPDGFETRRPEIATGPRDAREVAATTSS